MKFTINCDCTPEEARAFFGLPDFQPMQEAVMADMQEQMKKNMSAMDPENMMKFWMGPNAMGGGMQAFSELQQSIWQQMMSIANSDETAQKTKK